MHSHLLSLCRLSHIFEGVVYMSTVILLAMICHEIIYVNISINN